MNNKIYLIGMIVFCLGAGGLLYYMGSNSKMLYLQSEAVILDLQKKRQHVVKMEMKVRGRSFLLIQMFNEPDVFRRDNLYQKMNAQAYQFRINRESFSNNKLSDKENKEFESILGLVVKSEQKNILAADYMMSDEMDEAGNVLFSEGIPVSYDIIEGFSRLLVLVDNESQLVLVKLQEQVKKSQNTLFVLTALFIFVAVILVVFMFNRLLKDEELLTDSEAIKDSILDTAMDAILSVDKKGTISQFNKSAEKMFGYSANKIIGNSIEVLLLENFNDQLDQLHCMSDVSVQGISHQTIGCKKAGDQFPVQISISDTGMKTSTRFSLIVRDLTEIKKSEEELKARSIELEFAKAKYKELSETDPLTKVANRRVYEERINIEINSAKRLYESLSLLMIDVDYFKKYNDHYGHDSGDVALIRVAKTIEEALPRSTDLVARFGGEEFVVIMPLTNIEGALTVAERIKFHVKALAISHDQSDVAPVVTVSIGVSCLKGKLLNEADLLNSADKALYSAKKAGRNRCVVFEETIVM